MSFSSRDTLATASYRKGACLCGKVQFTVPEQSEGVGLCHCDDCSTNAGGPFQIVSYLQCIRKASECPTHASREVGLSYQNSITQWLTCILRSPPNLTRLWWRSTRAKLTSATIKSWIPQAEWASTRCFPRVADAPCGRFHYFWAGRSISWGRVY